MKKRKAQSAYLTVYMALSFTAMLAVFLVLLDGLRLNSAQFQAELIVDVATDSLLAEYHREMLRQYGMFWIDTSYGTKEPSVALVEAHLRHYLERNCSPLEQWVDAYLYRDLLGLQIREASVNMLELATDDGGSSFRARAVEVVKDEVGLSYLEKVAQWIEMLEENRLQEEDMEVQMKQSREALFRLEGKQKVGEQWVNVEIEDPLAKLEMEKQKGILRQVLERPEEVSMIQIRMEDLISVRKKRGEINEGNWMESEEDGWWDQGWERLLWQEYLLRYFGYYGCEKPEGLLKYQLEYLIGGQNSDLENLKSVVWKLCSVRWAAAAMYLFGDAEKTAQAETAAAVLMTLVALPEATELAKTLILLGWSYAEAVYDTGVILAGGKVPLLENEESWHYSAEKLWEGVLDGVLDRADAGEKTEEGLAYGDYLRIFLALTPLEEQTFRAMDVVEMDIRKTPGNRMFRMDGCADRLEVLVVLESAYKHRIRICTQKAY